MMLSYYLNKSARRNPNLDHRESKSLRLKRNLCIINIFSILLATYFFIRHNDHCEGGSEYKEHFSNNLKKSSFIFLLIFYISHFVTLKYEHLRLLFFFIFSIHSLRILWIYCRPHKHGLSPHIYLWFPQSTFNLWLDIRN